MRFWLEYAGHRFELKPGALLIGRASSCQIMLEDGLVSRRHAELSVTGAGVSIRDFGSVNGVYVNAQRVQGTQQLLAGDRIMIGKQEMVLRAAPKVAMPGRLTTDTLGDVPSGARPTMTSPMQAVQDEASESTSQGSALELLGSVAEKTLALGRGDEAERILSAYLLNLRSMAQQTGFIEAALAEKAVRFAVKIAAATGKGSWVDYAIDLYRVMVRPLPADVVDQLFTVLRTVRDIDLPRLREYVAQLKTAQNRFGPSERFVVQRLEGLERLAGAG